MSESLTFYAIKDKESNKYVVPKYDCNLWLSKSPNLNISEQVVIDLLDDYKCDNDYKCHDFLLKDTEIVPMVLVDGE